MEQSRDNVAISFCWDQVLDKCKAGSSGIKQYPASTFTLKSLNFGP